MNMSSRARNTRLFFEAWEGVVSKQRQSLMRGTMQRSNGRAGGMRGFTLLELSVVVLVITLLLGSLLIPLATQVEQRNMSETHKRLQEVKEALIGYAIANGRFPCPAEVTSPTPAPTDKGEESFAAGGNAANGDCKHMYDGYVPGKTLGLANLDSQGFAVDAWGLQQNRIRYAIANVTMMNGASVPVPRMFTTQNGMRSVGVQQIGTPSSSSPPGQDLLFVCATNGGSSTGCGTAPVLTSDAVFVVYSLGKNAATTGGANADEAVNLAGNPVFVSKLSSSTQAAGDFDDIVLWTSRYHVISQLTGTGQLP
jgi:prepilin-type N-terminal cleavage/methylation domain-containing protein